MSIIEKFGRIKILPNGEIILDVSYTASSIRQEHAREFIAVYPSMFKITNASKKTAIYKLDDMPLLLLEKYTTTRGNIQLTIYYEDSRIEKINNPTIDELFSRLSRFKIGELTLAMLIKYLLS